MFYVVGCHVINMGANFFPPLLTEGGNYYISTLYDSFFMMAVDCFVIISGYFGIKLRAKKIVSLMLPVYFYSIVLGGAFCVMGLGRFSLSNLFPVLRNSYWFLTSYLMLCLFSPFLNNYVSNSSKQLLLKMLCVLYFLFSIIPSFSFFSLTHDDGFGIINFIVMYLTGRFLAKIKERLSYSWIKLLLIHLLIVTIIFSENIIGGIFFNYNNGYQGVFWHYDNLFVILGSITLFLLFLNIKFENNAKVSRAICWLSPSFFYIYIIHCTSPLQGFLFKIVDEEWFINAPLFFINTILIAILIYVVCLLIDIVVRRLLLQAAFSFAEKISMRVYNKVDNIVLSKSNKLLQ